MLIIPKKGIYNNLEYWKPTEYYPFCYRIQRVRSMKVSKLSEQFVRPLDEYLREDPVNNAYLIYDLQEERDKSDFYIAFEGSDIKGLLLVYRGFPSFNAILRGEKEAASELVKEARQEGSVDWSSCWCPPELTPKIKPSLTVKDQHPAEIMSLKKGEEERLVEYPVKELTKEDSGQIAGLWFEWYGDSFNDSLKRVKEGMDNPKKSYYGIKERGKLISVASTTEVPPEIAIVSAVYTKPEYREKGYGTSVVSKAVQEGLKEADKSCLIIRGENPPAKHIYEKLGFTTYCKFDWLDL